MRRFPVKIWFGPPERKDRVEFLKKLLKNSEKLKVDLQMEDFEEAAELLTGDYDFENSSKYSL